ncbi:MAG TPA: zinc ribbon domain-containing protein [Ktedonobacterales bacterium]|nr:zinc ribbon domain-containing protein [Ktedonobacterales bacterium]
MGYDASAPPCPRCGTPFPLTGRFCPGCGLTQEVAQDPLWRASASIPAVNDGAAQNIYNANAQQLYGPAGTRPYDPAGQQPYVPAGQQPYGPPAQQPPAGTPDDPFARSRKGKSYEAAPLGYFDEPPPKRSFWRSAGGVSLIVLLLLMVVGASAFGIYFYPQLCSSGARNNLPTNIPLPCGITFQDHLDRSASGTTGPGSQEWVYTADGQSPAQLATFYQNNLPSHGWKLPASIQDPTNNAIAACQGQTVALIRGQQGTVSEGSFTFTSPSGGSVLLIILAPLKNLASQIQQGCNLA